MFGRESEYSVLRATTSSKSGESGQQIAENQLNNLRELIHKYFGKDCLNIPTVSFGLSLAWVSLATGTNAEEPQDAVVGGAGATHAASIIGVLLSAAALKTGRKPPLIASSAAFALCWGLKIHGGYWSIVVARLAAGLAGAAAWTAAPLMGREVSSGPVRGAAAAAPVLAHNFGFLLMYAASDAGLPHKVILWCCLSVALFHCLAFLLVPESPSFLAASGKLKEARASLAWLRGIPVDNPQLSREIETLPPIEDTTENSLTLIKEVWTNRQRRRALILSVIAVAGQECCGLLALMQFAEQVFAEASGTATSGASPARNALILGAVQLIASGLALYLVERVGRRPLIVWTAVICAGCLVTGTTLAWVGGSATWLAVALAGAVAADSLGMQPAPYALLADMFDYRYRGCALLVATGASAAGNALEVALFGAAATAGMHAALGLAAALTISYALFAIFAIPETRNKEPEEIYENFGCKHDKNNKDIEAPDVKKDDKLRKDSKVNETKEIFDALYAKDSNDKEITHENNNASQSPEIFVTCEAKVTNLKENTNKTENAKQNSSINETDSKNEDLCSKRVSFEDNTQKKSESCNDTENKQDIVLESLSCLASQEMPSCRPAPETALVAQMCHGLSRIRSRPRAVEKLHLLLESLSCLASQEMPSCRPAPETALVAQMFISRIDTKILESLSCLASQEMPSCRPAPETALVAQMCHGLSRIRSRPRAVEI
ncbi:sugar transporter domain-containing protein [Phthorimaea operculella]|nr:sugar transporter domain-containing protein [Phthorimaea operculella]